MLISPVLAADMKIVHQFDYDHSICANPILESTSGVYSLQRLSKPTTGDTTFKIRKDVLSSSPDFIEIPCYKLRENQDIVIYAEVEQFDSGYVTTADVDIIERYLCEETPQGSVDPAKGILAILNQMFGSPPDVDGNGKIIVLLVDVRDNYSEGANQSYVAGYFDPYDQQKNYGNYGDIIYIDTYPAVASALSTLSTVAHELQHLIHYRYDRNEETWLNEALSELAPRVCGLPARTFGRYLNNPGRSLLKFDNTLYDYTKCALFSFYLFKQYPEDFFVALVADGARQGLESIETVLQSGFDPAITREQLYLNWTIANILQGEGAYGYGDADIPVLIPNFDYASLPVSTENDYVQKYGSRYICFNGGMDISFEFHHTEGYGVDLIGIQYKNPVTIFTEQDIPQDFTYSDNTFGVTYSKLALIPVFVPVTRDSTPIQFSATGKGGYIEREISYDDGNLIFISLSGMTAAVKFSLNRTEGEKLDRVKVYLYNDDPTNIGILTSLSGSSLFTSSVISGGGWTTVQIPEGILPENATQFYVTVTSQTNALGYSDYTSGDGISYLKPGSGSSFQPLSSFQTGDGKQLTGNWGIRAVLRSPIHSRLIVSNNYLQFGKNEKKKSIILSNPGSEAIPWQTQSIPVWIDVSPGSGTVLSEYDTLRVTNLLDNNDAPGNYFDSFKISTPDSSHEIYVSTFIENPLEPQISVFPAYIDLDSLQTHAEIILKNTGIGALQWEILEQEPSVLLSSYQGELIDSLKVVLEVERAFLDRGKFLFSIPIRSEYNTDSLRLRLISNDGISAGTKYKKLKIQALNQPFNPLRDGYTHIRYVLPVGDRLNIGIFNLLGQEIYSFPVFNVEGGIYQLTWDGRTKRGKSAPSGIYFVYIRGKKLTGVGRIVILR